MISKITRRRTDGGGAFLFARVTEPPRVAVSQVYLLRNWSVEKAENADLRRLCLHLLLAN